VAWAEARRARGRSVHGLRSRAGQRGAVAVETALITPVLLIVLLGIIELPMLIRDYVAITSAARTGGRVAAAAPDSGNCVPNPLDVTPCPANAVPNFVQIAADAVSRNGTALPAGSIRSVLVYKANANGFPGSLTSMPASCAGITSCVAYTWNQTAGKFKYSGGTWDSRTVNACFPSNIDSVGVQLVADHKFLSGLLGTSMEMSDHTVMNFEPLPPGSCAAGSHA
jgi:Flp pilus assembly protein TadG